MCFAALWEGAPTALAFDRRGARVGLRGGMRRHAHLRPLPASRAWRGTFMQIGAAAPTRTHWPCGCGPWRKKVSPCVPPSRHDHPSVTRSLRRAPWAPPRHTPTVQQRACSAGPDRPRCSLAPALRTTSVPCVRSNKHTQHRGTRRSAATPPSAAPASPWAAPAAVATVQPATRGAVLLPAPGPAGVSACNVPHPPNPPHTPRQPPTRARKMRRLRSPPLGAPAAPRRPHGSGGARDATAPPRGAANVPLLLHAPAGRRRPTTLARTAWRGGTWPPAWSSCCCASDTTPGWTRCGRGCP